MLRRSLSFVFLILGASASSAYAEESLSSTPSGVSHGSEPRWSVAIERLGGVSYSSLSADSGGGSTGATSLSLGGLALNPYTAPRIGVDYGLAPNLWLGGAVGFSRTSATVSTGSSNDDLGAITAYTLSPRVGYRMTVQSDKELLLRGGLTMAGGSYTSGDSKETDGVFALAISAETVAILRVTSYFNLLGGVALDRTVAASASSQRTSGSGSSSKTDDIKGALTSVHLWLGLGVYL